MSDILIKICGISDAEMAKKAISLGAHFIGLVFHPSSKRFVNMDQAKEIAQAILEENALPVAVFVDHSADEMHHICHETNIKIVQLHGNKSRAEQHLLADNYQRIYVQSGSINNEIIEANLSGLDPLRDYLLIDNEEPGQGYTFDWRQFKYAHDFRWFLAGGLTPQNVKEAIHILKPNGVDVSSGVEESSNKKSSHLIHSFIESVRGSTHV